MAYTITIAPCHCNHDTPRQVGTSYFTTKKCTIILFCVRVFLYARAGM